MSEVIIGPNGEQQIGNLPTPAPLPVSPTTSTEQPSGSSVPGALPDGWSIPSPAPLTPPVEATASQGIDYHLMQLKYHANAIRDMLDWIDKI